MCLSQENANLDENLESTEAQPESMDFDMLEKQLQEQLDESYADLAFLEEEKEKIGNPDNLGNVVMDVVWEQFLNQVGINSGEEFIESNNPGLKSRFNTFIEFPDYSAPELNDILLTMCKSNDYTIEPDAEGKIAKYLNLQVQSKGENFANGRLVRNLFDDLVMNHAKRVIKIANPSYKELSTITVDDFHFEDEIDNTEISHTAMPSTV